MTVGLDIFDKIVKKTMQPKYTTCPGIVKSSSTPPLYVNHSRYNPKWKKSPNTHFHTFLVMPERLVSTTLTVTRLLRIVIQWHPVSVLILSVSQEWARNALISASSLLDAQASAAIIAITVAHTLLFGIPKTTFVASMVWVAPSAAAADAEQPEQRRGPAEDDTEPHYC